MLSAALEVYRQDYLKTDFAGIVSSEKQLVEMGYLPWGVYASKFEAMSMLTFPFNEILAEDLLKAEYARKKRKLNILLPFSPGLEFEEQHGEFVNNLVAITACDFGDDYYRSRVGAERLPSFRRLVAGDIHSKDLWNQIPYDFDLVFQYPVLPFEDPIFEYNRLSVGDTIKDNRILNMHTYLKLFSRIYNRQSSEDGLFYTQIPNLGFADYSEQLKLLHRFQELLFANNITLQIDDSDMKVMKVIKHQNSPASLREIDFSQLIA